jgi:hypothetical protein
MKIKVEKKNSPKKNSLIENQKKLTNESWMKNVVHLINGTDNWCIGWC